MHFAFDITFNPTCFLIISKCFNLGDIYVSPEHKLNSALHDNGDHNDGLIDWLYQSFTAHQHQKGHTVPKQVSPLHDDDDITVSTRKKCYGSTVSHLEKKSSNEQGNAHYSDLTG